MPRESIDEPLLPDDVFEKLILEGNVIERQQHSWRRNAVLAASIALNIILLLGYAFPLEVAKAVSRPEIYCELKHFFP